MALDRETVVRRALRLLNQEGLNGLTLRKLAGELDVQAPALYWHFKNKQELLDEMATQVLADAADKLGQVDEDKEWPEWIAVYARGLRQMLLKYRDGAKMFSGTYLTDAAQFAPMEFALRKLTGASFSLRDAVDALSTVYCYAIGFTIEEQAVYPQPGKRSPQYDPAKRAARIDKKKMPLARSAGKEMFSSYDDRFERGVQVIVRGLKASVR